MAAVAAWWVFVFRYEARELWRALPGPWWVKVLLIVVCTALPGPQDELILLAIVAVCRKRKARRVRRVRSRYVGPLFAAEAVFVALAARREMLAASEVQASSQVD